MDNLSHLFGIRIHRGIECGFSELIFEDLLYLDIVLCELVSDGLAIVLHIAHHIVECESVGFSELRQSDCVWITLKPEGGAHLFYRAVSYKDLSKCRL